MVEEYEKIAKMILERPENIPNSLHNVLLKLAETHPGAVYWIVRKFYQEYLRLYVSDTGYIGFADRYVPDIMYPGDIALYMIAEHLNPGDVVQITFTDREEVSIFAIHGRVHSFNPDGSIEIKDIRTNEQYTVVTWNLLGKLVKVIPFGSADWNELFGASVVSRDWIATVVEETIESEKKAGRDDADPVLQELKSRLSQVV